MNRFEKAALFGSMFGRKFTPDLKLQMALIAEREKLMDVWEEGGTDWSPETHPDMGGNPEFDRRWNKAFNEKEEVEPKAPPTPLHESKPSWFPFRTQGMIDKARDAEYLRSDNEEAWDDNDFKTERALRDDHTREGVNNILNHYLDRNHGIVKNPYRHPADLDGYVDYKGMVQKSVPWKPSTDIDNINALFEETQIGDYKSPANRQKLFDQYYPYLDLAPSAKPSKKGPIAKAAAFGAMMGKRASLLKSGMTFDAEDYLYDTKPVNFLYNGQPSWMMRNGDTLASTAWDGNEDNYNLSGSMYPLTRKGKLIQEPDEAELKRYYLAGLNKKLRVPGAKVRAWYTGSAEVPEKKRRLWGLLPDKLNYDFNDEDYNDIEHGATPEARQAFINRLSDVIHGRPHAGRVETLQALGEPIGGYKYAAGEAPAAPQPSARDIQIHNARMELQRKGQMVRDAAGGNGAYGTSRGTMKDGVIQPGATFTPREGQQGQRPLTGAGGQSNTPPVPRGQQPVPPTSSPVIESKTPKRLF